MGNAKLSARAAAMARWAGGGFAIGATLGVLFFHPVGMLIGHLANPAAHIEHGRGLHLDLLAHAGTAFRPDHFLMAGYSALLFALVGAIMGLAIERARRSARRIVALERLLPICASCKLIRKGEEWVTVEQHFSETHGTEFSHGICPSCAEALYPEWAEHARR